MNNLIQAILEKNYNLAEQLFNEHMESIAEHHLMEMKKTIDLTEGVGNYSLKKVKKYKNPEKMSPEEIWDNDGNDASYTKYHVTKDGKTIGRLRRHDYFGGTFARINGKTTELKKGKSGSGPLSKLHAYVKYKKGKLEEETIEEGRYRGIRNKKKKSRLAQQTADLRNTFGVAPGKRRHQGPRTAKLEEEIIKKVSDYFQAKRDQKDRAKVHDIEKGFRKELKKSKTTLKYSPREKPKMDRRLKVNKHPISKGKSVPLVNEDLAGFKNVAMSEGYYKNKQIEKDEEARGEPPFIPDDPKAPHHTSKNLARRAKKTMIRKSKEKLDEGREVPNPSGKKWYEGRIRREKDIPDEAPKSDKKKEKMYFKSKQKLDEGLSRDLDRAKKELEKEWDNRKKKKKKKVRKYGSYLRSKLGYEPGRD